MKTRDAMPIGIAAMLVFSVASCGPAKKAEEHEQQAASAGLELDGGKKWMADTHTAQSFVKMDELVSKSPAMTDTGALQDYVKLGTDIQEAINDLIRGCKMTGPAHEQLHLILVKLFPQVKALGEAKDIAAAKLALTQVSETLAAYRRFFDAPK